MKRLMNLMIAQAKKAPVVLATKSRQVSWLSKLNGPIPKNSKKYSANSFKTPSIDTQANKITKVNRQGNFNFKVFNKYTKSKVEATPPLA